MVCAVHPFGPEHNTCNDYTSNDFVQRAQEPSQLTSTKLGRDNYIIDFGIQLLLIKSLLLVCGLFIMANLANKLIPRNYPQTQTQIQTGTSPKAILAKCRGLSPNSYPFCRSGGQIK
jgi:hypothetical protein